MVLHTIPANILSIVNVIFADGIRVFLNTLTKKIEVNCKIVAGLVRNYTTRKISARIIC